MPLVYVEGDDPSTWDGPPDDCDGWAFRAIGIAELGSNRDMWGAADNETFSAVMTRMVKRAKAIQQCEREGCAGQTGPVCCVMGSFASDAAEASAAAEHGLLTPDELATALEYSEWFHENVCPGPAAVIVINEPRHPRNFTAQVCLGETDRAKQLRTVHVMAEDSWTEDTPLRILAFLDAVVKLPADERRIRCGLPLAAPTPKDEAENSP